MKPLTRMRMWRLGVATVITAGGAVGALSLAGEEAASATPLERLISVAPEQADQRIARLAENAPSTQAAALADGHATLGEYRAAVAGTVGCLQSGFRQLVADLRREGRIAPGGQMSIEVHGPTVSADEFALVYSYSTEYGGLIDPSSQDLATLSELDARCQSTNQSQVEEAYQLARLSDEDFVSQVTADFVDCLAAAGLDALGSSERQIIESIFAPEGDQRESVGRCLQQTPSVNTGLSADS